MFLYLLLSFFLQITSCLKLITYYYFIELEDGFRWAVAMFIVMVSTSIEKRHCIRTRFIIKYTIAERKILNWVRNSIMDY